VILQTQNRMVEELASYAAPVELFIDPSRQQSVKARVVNCPLKELISMTGHKIIQIEQAKEVDDRADVAVMFTIFPDGGYLCSIRSAPSFNASVIAKAWDGGGHAQACGFKGDIKDGLPWRLVDEEPELEPEPEPEKVPVPKVESMVL